MIQRFPFVALSLTFVFGTQMMSQACAQGFGSSGGYNSGSDNKYESTYEWEPGTDDDPLDPESALSVIKITGTAEQRVVPEQIRVVFALTSEGETAEECRKLLTARIDGVMADWKSLNIPAENIVEDFISVLPRYGWGLSENFEGWSRVRLQKHVGYRMQINLHVAVKTEADAMAAIDRAFRNGQAEIVTFDYWSSDLDRQKDTVRTSALAAAKKKADTLLAVFDERPQAVNVQESTAVFFPHSLYKTYENVLEQEVVNYDSDEPLIKAYRPKMTFFHGLSSRADTQPKELRMRPEIAVVSTVRIYYRSPAGGTAVSNSAGK